MIQYIISQNNGQCEPALSLNFMLYSEFIAQSGYANGKHL